MFKWNTTQRKGRMIHYTNSEGFHIEFTLDDDGLLELHIKGELNNKAATFDVTLSNYAKDPMLVREILEQQFFSFVTVYVHEIRIGKEK